MANRNLRYSRLEIAELCLRHKDTPDSLPYLTKSEIYWFIKEGDRISNQRLFSNQKIFCDFVNYYRCLGKHIPGISMNRSGTHYMVNIIQIWPFLLERKCVSVDLFDYCNELLKNSKIAAILKQKQLKPFSSEYFEQIFAVGSIIMIRFNKAKNIKRVQLTEIIYKPDSVSEISAVTFGSQSYTLEELKDNLEYFQNDQWLPFGVYE